MDEMTREGHNEDLVGDDFNDFTTPIESIYHSEEGPVTKITDHGMKTLSARQVSKMLMNNYNLGIRNGTRTLMARDGEKGLEEVIAAMDTHWFSRKPITRASCEDVLRANWPTEPAGICYSEDDVEEAFTTAGALFCKDPDNPQIDKSWAVHLKYLLQRGPEPTERRHTEKEIKKRVNKVQRDLLAYLSESEPPSRHRDKMKRVVSLFRKEFLQFLTPEPEEDDE